MHTDKQYFMSNLTDFTQKRAWYQLIYRLFNLYPTRVDIKVQVLWKTWILFEQKEIKL